MLAGGQSSIAHWAGGNISGPTGTEGVIPRDPENMECAETPRRRTGRRRKGKSQSVASASFL